jgi:hypothetical protein
MHLFEHRAAGSTLFGADPEIVLQSEHAYYRAARPRLPSAPSRLLWYVSQSPNFVLSQRVLAASQVLEVSVEPVGRLHSRHKRLGVFTYQDVLRLTKNNPQACALAFRFSFTELLPTPLAWSDLQQRFTEYTSARQQIQSPLCIPTSLFFRLYADSGGTCAR